MKNLITRFANDEDGATAIEYGLIAALIAVAIIASVSALGTNLSDRFEDVSEAVNCQPGQTFDAAQGVCV